MPSPDFSRNYLNEKELGAAIRLMRKGQWVELSKHPLANLTVVRNHVRSTNAKFLDEAGKEVRAFVRGIVNEMRDEIDKGSEEADQWNAFIDHYFKGHHLDSVLEVYSIGSSAFFDWRKRRIDALLRRINTLEGEYASPRINTLDERRWLYGDNYVERLNDNGDEYLAVLLDMLASPEVRIIPIAGLSGIGKTKLAWEAGQRGFQSHLFDVVTAVWMDPPPRTSESALNHVLNEFGKVLGRRDVKDLTSTEEKLEVILEDGLQGRSTLLIIDQTDPFFREDLNQLDHIVMRFPPDFRMIITTLQRGILPRHERNEIHLNGMRDEEALEYMMQLAENRGSPLESKQDLRPWLSVAGGNPAFIRALSPLAAVLPPDTASDLLETGELTHTELEEERVKLWRRTTREISKKNPEAIPVLYALSTVQEPVDLKTVSAAVDEEPGSCAFALLNLWQFFVIERKKGPNGSFFFGLLPSFKMLISAVKEEVALPDGKAYQDWEEVIRNNLVKYYISELNERLIGERLTFLGLNRDTVIDLLQYCYDTERFEALINLMDVVGRPLGIVGQRGLRKEWAEKAIESCDKLIARLQDEKRFDEVGHFEAKREWFIVHDLAWSLRQEKQVDKAKEIMERSLRVATERGYDLVKALVLRNHAQLLVLQDNTPPEVLILAVDDLQESIDLWIQNDRGEWVGHTYQVMGQILDRLDRLDEALEAFKSAYHHLEVQRHTDGQISALANLALVLAKQNREEKALQASNEAIEMARTELAPPAPVHGYALWRRAQLEVLRGSPPEIVIEWGEEALLVYRKAFASLWAVEAGEWLEDYKKEHGLS